jgi:GAF domain-containing protein
MLKFTAMKPAPLPPDEVARLNALKRYRLLNSLPEQVYDDITKLASEICGTPIAMLNLIDENRQWTKAGHGIKATEMPREQSFCAYAILDPSEVMIVPDARYDERFFDNPLVKGEPFVAFYAGMPILNSEGFAFGTLCLVDSRPRELSEHKLELLKALAKLVQTNFDLRFANMELQESKANLLTARPVVSTILSRLDSLNTSQLPPEQASQAALFRDTVIAFNALLEEPGATPNAQ